MSSSDQQKIRTFIAVHVPETVRKQIAEFQNRLKPYGGNIRWVRPESIHITLKFLGDVLAEQIESITNAIHEAVSSTRSFDISVEGTGVFPNVRRPKVFWVGVEKGSEELKNLAAKIDEVCSKLHFQKEERGYSAHLTIGRVRSQKRINPLMEALQAMKFEGGSYHVDEVAVMKSDLLKTGAVYTVLHQIKLQG